MEAGVDRPTAAEEPFGSLEGLWRASREHLGWGCPFVSPPWVRAWRHTLGTAVEPWILSVRKGGRLAGVAVLARRGARVGFLGSPDVCDYFDLAAAPGDETDVLWAVVEHARARGASGLDLGPVREDSVVARAAAGLPGFRVLPDGAAVEMPLPAGWGDYLERLGRKERHEVRRKIRRVERSGTVRRYTAGPADVDRALAVFLDLFRRSRPDKAAFLTPPREAFFRALARETAAAGWLRLSVVELDGRPAAAVLSFQCGGVRYLYNNGFDPEFRNLSIGIVSKVWDIRDAIAEGAARYEFLKGTETYKFRLGGREVPLVRCVTGGTP